MRNAYAHETSKLKDAKTAASLALRVAIIIAIIIPA